jgi:hypothetical protein
LPEPINITDCISIEPRDILSRRYGFACAFGGFARRLNPLIGSIHFLLQSMALICSIGIHFGKDGTMARFVIGKDFVKITTSFVE